MNNQSSWLAFRVGLNDHGDLRPGGKSNSCVIKKGNSALMIEILIMYISGDGRCVVQERDIIFGSGLAILYLMYMQ